MPETPTDRATASQHDLNDSEISWSGRLLELEALLPEALWGAHALLAGLDHTADRMGLAFELHALIEEERLVQHKLDRDTSDLDTALACAAGLIALARPEPPHPPRALDRLVRIDHDLDRWTAHIEVGGRWFWQPCLPPGELRTLSGAWREGDGPPRAADAQWHAVVFPLRLRRRGWPGWTGYLAAPAEERQG